ncbi:glutamyl-tRNA amidotransferase [Metamycoplasma phocicerebrale]|uniref:Glutamyl-tRNA amidotransferase n=1 Tax=Metamycoplasma phocicerebrale TaxID=142649 RepID=A0A3T0TTD0_9BACT|nr:glutamyl-tRNA amidotransferase [Metamycoplasma phocicerebrale]AZZ65293.1 glutamyl-tRNA amidotransferase [Metamycoplasma phocicerebrale]
MTKTKMKELANNLLLEPTEDIFEMVNKLLSSIDSELKDLDEYDLNHIKALSHINEQKVSFFKLREDIPNDNTKINKQYILKNAATSDSDYVTIKKVINGD